VAAEPILRPLEQPVRAVVLPLRDARAAARLQDAVRALCHTAGNGRRCFEHAGSLAQEQCVRGAVRERSTRSGLPWRSQAQHSLGDLAGGGVFVGRQRCSCSGGHAAVAPRPPLAPRASRSMLRRVTALVG